MQRDCSLCAVRRVALKALTVAQTQSHSSYPLHFLLAADAIIVTQSGIGLREASWETQTGEENKRGKQKRGVREDTSSCFWHKIGANSHACIPRVDRSFVCTKALSWTSGGAFARPTCQVLFQPAKQSTADSTCLMRRSVLPQALWVSTEVSELGEYFLLPSERSLSEWHMDGLPT